MANGKKKEGRCVQTENNRKMCKHIKDKEIITFCPTTPFAPKRCKKSAKKDERRKTRVEVYTTKKSEMIVRFLRQTKNPMRSIVNLCEQSGY